MQQDGYAVGMTVVGMFDPIALRYGGYIYRYGFPEGVDAVLIIYGGGEFTLIKICRVFWRGVFQLMFGIRASDIKIKRMLKILRRRITRLTFIVLLIFQVTDS